MTHLKPFNRELRRHGVKGRGTSPLRLSYTESPNKVLIYLTILSEKTNSTESMVVVITTIIKRKVFEV